VAVLSIRTANVGNTVEADLRHGRFEMERLVKKAEILERVHESHTQLINALDGLSEVEATRVGLNPQWSIKDALAHIVIWEEEGTRILDQIRDGSWQPRKLNKEAIDDFNAAAVEQMRNTSLADLTAEFDRVHSEMLRRIELLPEDVDEGSTEFQYVRGVTFRHMAHHAAQIEKFRNEG
jgi:uncharacterized damage-inducible protein DinB